MQGDILLKYWFLHSVFTYHFYITVGFRAFNLIVGVKVLVAQPCPTLQFTATLWTIAHQTPLSMEFSRQECWSGFPFPSPGDLPNPGIEPASLTSPALVCGFFTTVETQTLSGIPGPAPTDVGVSLPRTFLLPGFPQSEVCPQSLIHGGASTTDPVKHHGQAA